MNYDEQCKKLIKNLEGCVLQPYQDSEGFPTVGYGHKLLNPDGTKQRLCEIIDRGTFIFTKEDADRLFEEDFRTAFNMSGRFSFWDNLNPSRKMVIVAMVFQMGFRGVSLFKKMCRCLDLEDFFGAYCEMIDSRWYLQTNKRCHILATIMLTGDKKVLEFWIKNAVK